MNLKLILIPLCLLSISVISQNLLRNAGFEEKRQAVGIGIPDDLAQVDKMTHWKSQTNKVNLPGYRVYAFYHSPDWIDHNEDHFQIGEFTLDFLTNPLGIDGPNNVLARNGSRFVGIRRGEIVQQKLDNSLLMQDDKEYILTLNIYHFEWWEYTGGDLYRINNNPYNGDQNFLRAYVAKERIKYEDKSSWNWEKKNNQSGQTIIQVMDIPLDPDNDGFSAWRQVQAVFRAPENGADNYKWFGFELVGPNFDDENLDYYIAVDDVSLEKGCIIQCSNTDGILSPAFPNPQHNVTTPIFLDNLDNVDEAEISIITALGVTVRNFTVNSTNGINEPIFWGGNSDNGTEVAAGNYILKARLKNACDESTFNFPFVKINELGFTTDPVPTNIYYSGGIETPSPCCLAQPDIFIDGVTINGPGWLEYKAAQSILIGQNAAVTMNNTANVLCQAQNQIIIDPTNSVNVNAEVAIFEIQPCTSFSRRAGINNVIESTILENNNYKETNESNEKASLIVFPNPSEGKFTVKLNNSIENDEIQIRIFDLMGNSILSKRINNQSNIEFDISDNPNGVYFLQINIGDTTINKKIVKQ